MKRFEPSNQLQELIDNRDQLEERVMKSGEPDFAVRAYNSLLEKIGNETSLVQRLKLMDQVAIAAGRVLYGGMHPSLVPLGDVLYLQRLRDPNHDSLGEEKYRERVKGPLTAIRAYCLHCQGGEAAAVRTCESTFCPMWPFRMATNPFYGKIPDAEVDAIAEDEPDEPEEQPVVHSEVVG